MAVRGLRVAAVGLLLWICFTCYVYSEMRFVCPRPQLPNSRILEGPCGTGLEVPFEANYVELSPGPFTIQLEETVAHKGSPIRIALMEWNTNTPPCVLLDHIPHNDQATVRETRDCRINGYPIGHCYTAFTYITVEIPDVECDRCVLQMINVATDEYTPDQEPCHQSEPSTNNCTTFYSCANVRIKPTVHGQGKTLGSCVNQQLTLLNRWPYTPAEKYQIDLGEPFDETNYFRLYERPDRSVHYEYSLSNHNISVRRGSVALFDGIRPVRFFGATEGRLKFLTADERRKLKSGAYAIRITGRYRNGTFPNFYFPVNGSVGLYGDKMYRDHSAVYSSGMLAEKKFRGPGATYPQVNFPSGECQAPGKESYGAVLTLYKSKLPRALVSYTVNRDLLYAHVASSFELDRIVLTTRWKSTKGDTRRQNHSFNRGGTKGVFYEGADFIGRYLLKTGGRRPNQISMVVRQGGELKVLFGDIQKGIKGFLKNGLTTLGLIFITFPENSQEFNLNIMISNTTSILTEGYLVSLVGPYKSIPINRFAPSLTLNSNMVYYNVTVPIVDMEVALFFWTGQLQVSLYDAHTQKIYFAKLETLTESVCRGSKNVACKSKIIVSEYGDAVDRGQRDVFANGLATVGVSTTQSLMAVSISVRDLQPGETVSSVQIRRNGVDSFTLPKIAFSKIQNRIHGKALLRVDNNVLRDMEAGYLTLVVTLKRPEYRATSIVGRIPESAAYTPGLNFTGRKTDDIWDDPIKDRRKIGSAASTAASLAAILSIL